MSREPSLGPQPRTAVAAPGSEQARRPVPVQRVTPPGTNRRPPATEKTAAVTDKTSATKESATDDSLQPRQRAGRQAERARVERPSLAGGEPALRRELGAHGRETVRKLLAAGLAEFEETGFQTARVEDIVRRAQMSHGTFYLYFANKDDLFRTLLRDALRDMGNITDEFPIVTSNEAGRAALRRWVESFTETYQAHATVIRILSQAEIVGENVFGDGLQLLFRLSEAMTQGMTAAHQNGSAGEGVLTEHAELTAVACLMMLERINYLLSAEVRLPKDEMIDRLSAIIYAAFRS